MVSLEQVKLLESKVAKTIDYVNKVTGENLQLKEKMLAYEKQIKELEVQVKRFDETQSRIEDGIMSALDRLNKFEDALETKLSAESGLPTESKSPEKESQPSAKSTQEKNEPQQDIPGETPIEELSSAGELDIF